MQTETHTRSPEHNGLLHSRPSLRYILNDLQDELGVMVNTTIALFKKELTTNAENSKIALQLTLFSLSILVFGIFLAVLGIDILLITLLSPDVMSLETAAWVCTTTLGGLMILVGAVLSKKFSDKLSPDEMIPSKTFETLEDHLEWIGEKFKHHFK